MRKIVEFIDNYPLTSMLALAAILMVVMIVVEVVLAVFLGI